MKYWQRGEVGTIITIGTLLVLGISTLISTVFLNNTKRQTTATRAAGVGECRDNPVQAPAGYRWKADCGQISCSTNANCPQNTSDPSNVKPDTSNWCYGFEGKNNSSADWRCLMLVKEGGIQPPAQAPQGGQTPTSTPAPAGGQAVATPIPSPTPAPATAPNCNTCRYSQQESDGVKCYEGVWGANSVCQWQPGYGRSVSCEGVYTCPASSAPGGASAPAASTGRPAAQAPAQTTTPSATNAACTVFEGSETFSITSGSKQCSLAVGNKLYSCSNGTVSEAFCDGRCLNNECTTVAGAPAATGNCSYLGETYQNGLEFCSPLAGSTNALKCQNGEVTSTTCQVGCRDGKCLPTPSPTPANVAQRAANAGRQVIDTVTNLAGPTATPTPLPLSSTGGFLNRDVLTIENVGTKTMTIRGLTINGYAVNLPEVKKTMPPNTSIDVGFGEYCPFYRYLGFEDLAPWRRIGVMLVFKREGDQYDTNYPHSVVCGEAEDLPIL
jgi:hypothetical protein